MPETLNLADVRTSDPVDTCIKHLADAPLAAERVRAFDRVNDEAATIADGRFRARGLLLDKMIEARAKRDQAAKHFQTGETQDATAKIEAAEAHRAALDKLNRHDAESRASSLQTFDIDRLARWLIQVRSRGATCIDAGVETPSDVKACKALLAKTATAIETSIAKIKSLRSGKPPLADIVAKIEKECRRRAAEATPNVGGLFTASEHNGHFGFAAPIRWPDKTDDLVAWALEEAIVDKLTKAATERYGSSGGVSFVERPPLIAAAEREFFESELMHQALVSKLHALGRTDVKRRVLGVSPQALLQVRTVVAQ